ncbi:hypothetical protein [Hyalangium rubrum]|uniref:Lipoprotein n=1 Tax=Hyalangium rubrum TaxID=3103134 RepID=A0ABU5HGX8_9BACT|nr:hypothetical protein [Hyalangium sp. s54d21]MDY7232716.1 hypothetical protein [Hyalangium sp. s54d21]
MRRELMKVWNVLPVAVLVACGNVPSGDKPAEALGQQKQAVLYVPPPSTSGNIYDSTTYLGPVNLGGSVQTYFTQNPQFYSFKVTVPGSITARFEVTHGGSSMNLDTGLMVYGPRSASGSYGIQPYKQDDNYGYGDLSKIDEVPLTAGEYLVVVSSGSGSGKQFRLQTTCLSGACPTPSPVSDTSGVELALSEQSITAQLEATLEAGNDVHHWTEGSLRRFDFAWPYTSPPTLTHADAAVMALQEYSQYAADDAIALSYSQARAYLYSEFDPLHAQILATYGNGTENVQVATRYHEYPVAAGADGWFRLFVILFPQSKKVIVFEQTGYET